MKCLLVPLELEEFLYHRRKSYLAYKVTCGGGGRRGKSQFVDTFSLNIFTVFRFLKEQNHIYILMLLFLFIKSFKLGVSHECMEKALTWHAVLLLLTLQCFGWKWSRSSLLVYERVGVLFVGFFALFFFPNIHCGFFKFFFFLEFTLCRGLA